MLEKVRGSVADESKEVIRLIDSTTISLNQHDFERAKFRSHKNGWKLHFVYDPTTKVPTYFSMPPAKVNDCEVAKKGKTVLSRSYQFSFFQNEIAAFANIMMDYRPDNKAIRIDTPSGVRDYKGRFLGALLEEKAKVFGGTLTMPGITIPAEQEVFTDIENITTAKSFLEKT